jgi:SAM-dependent methyltransferase
MQGTQNFISLWSTEYQRKGIPSSFREEPSGSVVEFYRFLTEMNHRLDLGCGTGRNSLFLAEQGFDVHSVDFVPDMIEKLRYHSESQGLANRIHGYCQSVTDSWPFQPGTFDVAIDTFCYKHQIEKTGKETYRRELARVLKSGGFYLLTLAGIDDGYYGPLLKTSPNPRERVIVDPANGIPSILYSKEDIEREFADCFHLVHYRHKQRDWKMHGKEHPRSTHLFIFSRQ